MSPSKNILHAFRGVGAAVFGRCCWPDRLRMALLASYVRSAAATLPQDEEEEEKDGAGVEEDSGVCVWGKWRRPGHVSNLTVAQGDSEDLFRPDVAAADLAACSGTAAL